MIKRDAFDVLLRFAEQYPVVTVTGPRQAGKTTLVKAAFPDKKYVNLEHLSSYEFAVNDPVGFMAQLSEGAIIDEIQKVPQLLSMIQVAVDDRRVNGHFIITGSSQYELHKGVSQSLAGRTAILNLLPLSLHEMRQSRLKTSYIEQIYRGGFPGIIDRDLNPSEALDFYYRTYVERDIKELLNIKNSIQFQLFVKLCAGRTGQIVNTSSLANDVGVSHTTIREWMSVLETSYVIFRLQPYYANIGKRLMKSPKLYFYDVGLAAFLLGIEDQGQIRTHPLYGNLFENMVVSEFLKSRLNRGKNNNLYFLRDSKGNEIDLFIKSGNEITAVEIKAGMTVQPGFFKGFRSFDKVFDLHRKIVVYGGDVSQSRQEADIIRPEDIYNVQH